MPTRKERTAAATNRFAGGATSGVAKWTQRLGARSVRELRVLAARPSALKKAGIDGAEAAALRRMGALSRLFPANVASVLAERTPGTLAHVSAMDEAEFESLLTANGIAVGRAAYQRTRLAALRQRIGSGAVADDLNGLSLDLPANALSAADRATLQAAGVETLEDWPSARASAGISQGAREQLDSYASLLKVGVPGAAVERLRAAGAPGAYRLALSDDKLRKTIARKARIPEDDLLQWSRTAQSQIAFGGAVLANSLAYGNIGSPSLATIYYTPAGGGLFGVGGPAVSDCRCCPDEWSIFSHFAYFSELVKLSGDTLATLDDRLKQNFSGLNLSNGLTPVRQAFLCTSLLSRAYPGALTHAEQLPHLWHVFKAAVPMLGLSLEELAALAATLIPGLDTAGFAGRLRTFLPLPGTPSTSDFTFQEINAISAIFDAKLVDRVAADLARDPCFRGLSNAEIVGEARERTRKMLDPAWSDAEVMRRDAYKARSGLSDAELRERFCIDFTRGGCEMTTRIEQGILSLQLLIDQRRIAATTAGERAAWVYDSYDVWRGKRLAATFPEFSAITRDDVVTGEYGAAARGSLFRDGPPAREALRTALREVRDALGNARVGPGRDYDHAASFASSIVAPYFERGLGAIELILDADKAHGEAVQHLDDDEPGLALAKLDDALAVLDQLNAVVHRPEAISRDPSQSSYESLFTLAPAERHLREIDIGSEMFFDPKAIFEADPALSPIVGLDTATGKFSDLARWTVGPHFKLGTPADGLDRAGKLIKSGGGRYNTAASETIYSDGETFADYTLSCPADLHDADAFTGESNGEFFGLVARADGRSRYRLGIISQWDTSTYSEPETKIDTGNEAVDAVGNFVVGLLPHDDEVSTVSVLNGYLVLLRVDGNGNVSELARDANSLGWNSGTYSFTLTVTGRDVSGEVVIPGGHRRSLSVRSGTQPPRNQGTFGVVACESVVADFGPLTIEIARQGDNMFPPFFAQRRGTAGSRYIVDSEGHYAKHIFEGRGLARDVDPGALFRDAAGVDAQPLAWVIRDGEQLNLLFRDRQRVVVTDALDALLDSLLALVFYLRYAAIPVRLAQAYERTGDYAVAVKLLRILYDDEGRTETERSVCPFLAAAPASLGSAAGFDARALRIRIADIYLAWAEWLFRRDGADNRNDAWQYLERVLELHDDPGFCDCDGPYRDVPAVVTKATALALRGAGVEIGMVAAIECVVGQVLVALAQARAACVAGSKVADIFRSFVANPPQTADAALALLRQAKAALEAASAPPTIAISFASIPDVRGVLQQLLDIASSLDHAFDHFTGRSGLGGGMASSVLTMYVSGFCVPDDPIIVHQKHRACILLDHLANCRNILGFTDDIVPERRFHFLRQTAQQFTDLALAAEKDLLSYRQAFEQDSFSLLQAVNQLAAAEATTNIERLKADNALGDVGLAQLQLGQAQFTADHYQTLLNNGLSMWEQVALSTAWTSAGLSSLAVLPAIASMALAAAGVGVAATGVGSVPGAAMATIGALGTFASAAAGGIQGAASAAGAISSAASMTANFERRAEEWRYQLGLGLFGAAIAETAVHQAVGRYQIALAEQALADLGRRNAADAVQFLSSKFLNREMWVFMQRTMREQYRRRLNYAIGAAYMAERALSFELQREVNMIRFDYYDPRRDGMLGASQLATDVAALENTRLEQQGRQLQLTKNLSLASLMPADFEAFREGAGRFPFRTLLSWFDQDYPGHYLRLIKSVRLTVVALVPPLDGVHASLTNNGISKVVTGHPFEETTIRTNPEGAAYTAPYQATGVFQLDYAGEFRLPFEGGGVEADWVLELPRAANPFDFRTIADVIMTIEYTALADDGYRRRVQLALGNTRSGERAFSFKFNYPDLWYQLHNPDSYAQPMTVTFDTRAADFPANVAGAAIDQVMLYVLRQDGATFEIQGIALEYEYVDGAGAIWVLIATAADTANGVIATRRPDSAGAHPWNVFKGKTAVGRWRLTFPDTAAMRARWAQDEITDVAFAISYTGTTPGWPA